MFTIQVIDKYGKPASGKKVYIGFDGFWSGYSETKVTDSKGEVHFEEEKDRGRIYINSQQYGEYELRGRIVIYTELS